MKYVSLYREAPHYGGPEEGGWVFYRTYLIMSFTCRTPEHRAKAVRVLQRQANSLNEEERSRWSINGPDVWHVEIENDRGRQCYYGRPRYE